MAERSPNFKVDYEMHSIKNLQPDVLKFEKELNMNNEYGEQKIVASKFKGEEISLI